MINLILRPNRSYFTCSLIHTQQPPAELTCLLSTKYPPPKNRGGVFIPSLLKFYVSFLYVATANVTFFFESTKQCVIRLFMIANDKVFLLADAEVCEDIFEDVVGGYAAGDFGKGGDCSADILR